MEIVFLHLLHEYLIQRITITCAMFRSAVIGFRGIGIGIQAHLIDTLKKSLVNPSFYITIIFYYLYIYIPKVQNDKYIK